FVRHTVGDDDPCTLIHAVTNCRKVIARRKWGTKIKVFEVELIGVMESAAGFGVDHENFTAGYRLNPRSDSKCADCLPAPPWPQSGRFAVARARAPPAWSQTSPPSFRYLHNVQVLSLRPGGGFKNEGLVRWPRPAVAGHAFAPQPYRAFQPVPPELQ